MQNSMTAPVIYVLAAVASGIAYSLTDVTRKALMARVRALPVLCIIAWGAAPLFLFWWLRDGAPAVGPGYWLPAGVSIGLNIVSNLAFFEAVRRSPLSVTIPMLSLTPVFATILAVPMLGEVPTLRQAGGIFLVVAGAFLINLGGEDRLHLFDAWRALLRERGSLLMAGVAFAWSLATPLDKLAMAVSGVPFHGLALNFGVGAGAFAVLALRGRTRELWLPRGARWIAVLSLVASTIAIALFLVAIANVWIGLVESLKRGIGSAAALLVGYLMFDERIGGPQVTAVVLMSAGVALILL